MQAWRRSLILSPWMCMMGWMRDKFHGTPLQARSHSFHVARRVSWPILFMRLGLTQLIFKEQVYLAYYLRKQDLNNGFNLKGYSNAQSCNLFISSHLLWPVKRVIEAHEKFVHFEASPFGSSLEYSFYWASWWALGLRCMWAMDWALNMIWA